jgi:hypothetical protein
LRCDHERQRKLDKKIPANVKAEIVAEIDAAIARIEADREEFRALQARHKEQANQRARQIELQKQLRQMAAQWGFEGSITLR